MYELLQRKQPAEQSSPVIKKPAPVIPSPLQMKKSPYAPQLNQTGLFKPSASLRASLNQRPGPLLPEPIQRMAEESKAQKPRFSMHNNTGIPTQMKREFEEKSGLSFDDVRVHYNSEKPAQLQALAYTQGNQVYMGRGQEKHLRHELGHVVQQKQGRVSKQFQKNGLAVNQNPALEREADKAAISPFAEHKQEPVIQGLFTFQLRENEAKNGFVVTNLKYIRDMENNTLADTYTGRHTTADGIRKLFFYLESYSVRDFYNRLSCIMQQQFNRKSLVYIYEIINNFWNIQQRDPTAISEDDLYFFKMADRCRNSMLNISGHLNEMENLLPLCEAVPLNFEAALKFNNAGLDLLRNFETFYAYSPLINLNEGNQKGNNEGGMIDKAKMALSAGDLKSYAAASNGLFDIKALDSIENCKNPKELQGYLPWLPSNILNLMSVDFEPWKKQLIDLIKTDHAKMMASIWGDYSMENDLLTALNDHIKKKDKEDNYDPSEDI